MLVRKREEATEKEVKALQEYLRRQHEARKKREAKKGQLEKYCLKTGGIIFKELKV
jgi:hypothetical protein